MLAPADINPKAARLIGPAGSPIATEIRITPPTPNPFDIRDAKAAEGSNIEFRLEKKSDANGSHFILNISNKKKDPGRYSDKIVLTTTSTISPELVVRVFGIIR